MARKSDVKREASLGWDHYASKPASEAVPKMYAEATKLSSAVRTWYWRSIGAKRRASLWARAVSYVLAVAGVATPLVAAMAGDPATKLALTQGGVTALAIAGVALLGDKVFGWSSGWLRYVTTVTAMEKLALQFELDWASYFLAKSGSLGDEDKRPLFELTRQYEIELEKRRAEETDGWVAEFNSGMAALNELIKFQKDATEKAAQTARSSVEAQASSTRTGGIELTVSQPAGAPKPVTVSLDGTDQAPFTGSSWAKLGVTPGTHTIHAAIAGVGEAGRIADVPAGGVVRLEMKIP